MKKWILSVLILLISTMCYSQSYWTRVTDPIPNLVIMSMQVMSSSTCYACGSYFTSCPGAFLRTTNGGLNWTVTQFPEYSADDLCFLNDKTGYISAWQGPGKSYVLKTTNGGINWNKLDSNYASFFKIKFYDYNNGMIVSKYNTNHRTTDGGNTWITRYDNALWHEPNSLICLNAETWLVADKGPGINKTTNGGVNWQYLNFNSIGLNCVTLNFINSTTGFSVDYNAKVFKTTNAGNNWFKIDSIANVYNFNEASIRFYDEYHGYIASGNYFYKTTNGGYNWRRVLVNNNFYSSSSSFVYSAMGFIGGNDGLIYKTTTGGEAPVPAQQYPEYYELYQNYPNPFNNETNITFELNRAQNVKITIFNTSGKELTTLVNKSYLPGFYTIHWSGKEYPSGVYFYRMTTSNYEKTKKMILLK